MEIEIKVNDLKFKVFTADPETPELTIDSPDGKIYCFGVMNPMQQTICLCKRGQKEAFRKTAAHELTHAFIFAFGAHIPMDYAEAEEFICDFIGVHGQTINTLAACITERLWENAEN